MMKDSYAAPQFKRHVKRLKSKRCDMAELKTVIELLTSGGPLPKKYHDHEIRGNWAGARELHITNKPDWLLIYQDMQDSIWLLSTGSHDELFK
jgi:mRNA interferase YafQ